MVWSLIGWCTRCLVAFKPRFSGAPSGKQSGLVGKVFSLETYTWKSHKRARRKIINDHACVHYLFLDARTRDRITSWTITSFHGRGRQIWHGIFPFVLLVCTYYDPLRIWDLCAFLHLTVISHSKMQECVAILNMSGDHDHIQRERGDSSRIVCPLL